MSNNMESSKMTRNDFMDFFRNDEHLNTLSADDKVEIFRSILPGSSDFTKKLLDEILSDYSVGNLEISDHDNAKK
jgi:hypothetical protein